MAAPVAVKPRPPARPADAPPRRLRSAGLLHVPAMLLLIPVFLVPTLVMISKSFTSGDGAFGYYDDMFRSGLVRTIFVRSFEIAGIVTAVSLVVGLPFATIALKSGPRLRSLLLGAIGASLFFSVIVRAYAWLAILGPGGPALGFLHALGMNTDGMTLSRSRTAVILGMVQYGVPFMVLAITDVLRRVDGNIDRAAATLGAGPVTRWIRVTLPLIAPGITAGVTIVFTTSLGYFIIPAVLGSPKEQMVGQLISTQVGRTLQWGLGAALSATLLVVSLAVILVLRRLGSRLGGE